MCYFISYYIHLHLGLWKVLIYSTLSKSTDVDFRKNSPECIISIRLKCICPCTGHESTYVSTWSAPFIVDLITRWRLLVSVTTRTLYPGEESRCPLNERLVGFHNHSEHFWRKGKPVAPAGIRISNPLTLDLVAIISMLFRLFIDTINYLKRKFFDNFHYRVPVPNLIDLSSANFESQNSWQSGRILVRL